jgi:hypothetical protein
MVECRELGLVETFHDRKNGSIYETEVRITILVADPLYSNVVVVVQRFDIVGAPQDIRHQGSKDARAESSSNKLIDFDQHWCWYDKLFR